MLLLFTSATFSQILGLSVTIASAPEQALNMQYKINMNEARWGLNSIHITQKNLYLANNSSSSPEYKVNSFTLSVVFS